MNAMRNSRNYFLLQLSAISPSSNQSGRHLYPITTVLTLLMNSIKSFITLCSEFQHVDCPLILPGFLLVSPANVYCYSVELAGELCLSICFWSWVKMLLEDSTYTNTIYCSFVQPSQILIKERQNVYFLHIRFLHF